jgi:hypothetical protein
MDINERRWNETEPLISNFFVADLDEDMRALFFELRQLDGGYALLRLLNSRKTSLLTADDLAYYLKQPEWVVECNSRKLVELGWARQVDVLEWNWFGLTDDPQRREIVQALIDWEELWYRRMNDFQRLVDGAAIQPMVLPWDKGSSIPRA